VAPTPQADLVLLLLLMGLAALVGLSAYVGRRCAHSGRRCRPRTARHPA
jgi:hypothetical protein